MMMLADALRCKLCGKIMTEPVVVISTDSNEIMVGESFERVALEVWKKDNGSSLRYGPNPALKAMLVVYERLTQPPLTQQSMTSK